MPVEAPKPKDIVVFVIFLLIIALTHFSHSGALGLYEDDYYFIGKSWNFSATDLINYVYQCFWKFPEGRPLGFALPAILTYLGKYLGGLPAIYALACGLTTLNAFLLFRMAKQYMPMRWAFLAALTYAIFPADTTKPLLTHAFMLQPALTMYLLAFNLFFRKPIVAYTLMGVSLLFYESAFPLFGVMPFFYPKFSWQRLTKHLSIMGLLLAFYLILRINLGETRIHHEIFDKGFTNFFQKTIGCLVLGPLASGFALFWRLATAFVEGSAETWITIVLVGIVIYIAASRYSATSDQLPNWWKKSCLIGGLLLLASYSLAFVHYPPTILSNRGTAVHMAASVAYPWLVAGVGGWVSDRFAVIKVWKILVLALAIWAGFLNVVQQDFVLSWQRQKQFWRGLVKESPKVGAENTLILLDYASNEETRYISSYSWAMSLTLEQLFQFPKQWQNPPRVLQFPVKGMEKPGHKRIYTEPYAWYDLSFEQQAVIVLKLQSNRLTEVKQDSYVVEGYRYQISKKQIGNLLQSYPKKYLYSLLILD